MLVFFLYQDDANVSADHRNSIEFVRALSGVVLPRMCKATIASSADKPSAEEKELEKAAILKLGTLIKPFTLAGSLKHEMEVMFEGQKLCEKTGHKPGATSVLPSAHRVLHAAQCMPVALWLLD